MWKYFRRNGLQIGFILPSLVRLGGHKRSASSGASHRTTRKAFAFHALSLRVLEELTCSLPAPDAAEWPLVKVLTSGATGGGVR